jgi:hypothetical protein
MSDEKAGLSPKDAAEVIDEAVKAPSLDEYMKRDPLHLTDEDRRAMVEIHRRQRAEFIKNEEK